jgi:hypothetical protein
MTRIAALALLVLGLVAAGIADARTWKVGRAFNSCDGPCDFDDTSVGTDPGESIVTALQSPAVDPGDTVEVWPGDYTFPVPMASGVVLRAHAGLGTVRIVGSSGTNPAILMAGCNELTLIEDLVINWGQDNTGGGLAAFASSGTVRNCVFRNCRGAIGGAVYQQLANVRIENNLFIDCQATAGGGVIALSTATPTIVNNTFSGCTVPFGSEGATVYSIGADFIFDRNIVVGSNGAAAVYCQATAAPVLSCNIFWDNEFGPFSSTCSDSSGASGNLSVDPLICDIPSELFGVCIDSPAVTGPCGVIGYTFPGGNCPACGTTPTGVAAAITPRTWGSVKALYRH